MNNSLTCIVKKIHYINTITFDTVNPGRVEFFCPESSFTLQNIDLPLRSSSSNNSSSTMRCSMAEKISERKAHCVELLDI